MEILQSFEQYRQLTGGFRGRKDILSNFFFLPGAIKEAIGAGKLFVQTGEDTLFLFEKEQGFYRLYFYTTVSGAEQVRPDCGGALVAELPYAGKPEGKTAAMEACLLSWGFCLGRESGRMAAASQGLRRGTGPVSAVSEAEPEDLERVYALLYETFDPLYAFLPDRDGLLSDIREGNVLVYRKDDRILGVLRMERGKNYASISQFLVARENRSLGLGRILLEEFHRRCQEAPKFWHWVDLNNRRAVAIYEKEGYAFDGRYANEYIRIQNKE